MNKNHLYWVIPFLLIFGFIMGSLFIVIGTSYMIENYPVIGCIYHMEDSLNVETNKMPFTPESQRALVQAKCGREYINYNMTDDDLLIFEGE